jgi:hypothetical protein
MQKVLMSIAAMGIAAFAAVPALGQSFGEMRADKSSPAFFSGGLIVNGKVQAGVNITVSHPSTGTYVVHFKKNTLGGSPMLTCTPYGSQTVVPICTIESISINSNGVIEGRFVLYSSKTGTPMDSDFMFTEVTA